MYQPTVSTLTFLIMHPLNLNLAPPVVSSIAKNDEENWNEIQKLMNACIQEDDVVDAKVLGRLLRLVDLRLSLKYNCNVVILSTIVDNLLTIYSQKRISIPMKLKSLTVMTEIFKSHKNALNISVSYNYKLFWGEMLAICTRNAKDLSCGSEIVNSKLFQTMLDFLHHARYYTTQVEAEEMVVAAMDLLSDLRSASNMFGLQMLVICLPTSYSNYDAWVPIWLEKMAAVTHNEGWDACWLTLLCRARKYSANPVQWTQAALPQLLSKAAELLDPFASPSTTHPHVFPAYFSAMKVSPLDYRKTALKKIVKLVYMTLFSGPLLPTLAPITITPPAQARDMAIAGMNAPGEQVHSGLEPLVAFLQTIRPYLYPSNVTARTPDLGYFVSCLTTELGQHVGQTLLRTAVFAPLFAQCEASSASVQAHCRSNARDSLTMEGFFHAPTAKYLAGVLCTVSMEGLYAKSEFMVHCCTFSLRTLCAIDPSLGDVVMPFMLASLHPDAVNQSHMAPASMGALAHLFKPLLFPRPVLLPYLEQLLSLSLAGIDANDSKKTIATLTMYIYLFGWLPEAYVTYSNDDSFKGEVVGELPGNDYMTIAMGGDVGQAQDNYQNFRSTLNPLVVQWVPLLVDKLFSLLKVKEQLKNRDGKTPPSPLGPYIAEAFDNVISVLSHELRLSVARQVLDFALNGSNATVASTASKELAKMVESLCSQDDSQSSILQLLLSRLTEASCMDPAVTSSEKLVLHLRLIGGCFRQSPGSNAVADSVMFCFRDSFKHHSDKDVRKAVAKLLKDILKGLTSFYPLSQADAENEGQGVVVGSPRYTTRSSMLVSWHVPSEAGVATATRLLADQVTGTMREIEDLLGDVGEHPSEGTVLSVKQKEERLLTLLDFMQRGVRGVSELLGDEDCSQETPVLSTGREEVLATLPAEDATYLRGLRHSVVEFLNRLHVMLGSASSVPSGEDKMDVDINSSAISSASFASVVSNAPKIREIIMKLFQIVVAQRMGCMKHVVQIKKWHSMTGRVKKSALSNYMEKKLGRLYYDLSEGNVTTAASAAEVSLTSLEYWIGHDQTCRSLSERSFIQHVLRQKELSFSSTYVAINTNSASSGSLFLALQNLAEMNGHEYDSIRSSAFNAFTIVSQRFGLGLEAVISPLIETIRTPGVTFSAASGALKIFHLDLVMKRITGNFTLCLAFLSALRQFPAMVVAIAEADKRERLSDSLSSVFTKYLKAWHHSPLRVNDSNRQAVLFLIEAILSDFQVDTNASSVSAAESGGLRHELYLASSVIHFIGHQDIQPDFPVAVWSWLVTALRTKTDTPMQSLALAALTKLSLVQRSLDNAVNSSDISNLLAETFVSRGEMDKTSSGAQFLLGMSHGHVSAGGGAQWSKGVDQMLRNGEYLRNAVPRQDSRSADASMFSKVFQISNAALLMNALALALDNDLAVSLADMAASLIAASAVVPTTSDDEVRALNATKAELFAGLCRLLMSLEFTPLGVAADVIHSSWALAKDFLLDNINKASLDYCSDWAEAIAYGFGEFPQGVQGQEKGGRSSNVVSTAVLDLAAQTFLDSSSSEVDVSVLSESVSNGGSSSSSSGFTRNTKHVLLLIAFMVADVEAVAGVTLARYNINASDDITSVAKAEFKASFSSTSQVVTRVKQVLRELPGKGGLVFASPYLLLRQEMSKVLNLVTTAEIGSTPGLADVCERVVSECQNGCQGSQSVVVASSTTSSTTVVGEGDASVTIIASTSSAVVTNDTWKNACDCSTLWLAGLTNNKESWRYCEIVEALLKVTLEGCAHADITFSKHCHNTCKMFSQRVKVGMRAPIGSTSLDFLSRVLAAFVKSSEHSSLHIRETVMICLTYILVGNSASLTAAEKKVCKDVFARGMLDPKPEVQVLSRKGMICYLNTKPIGDLFALAASYIKNCDILAAREKKKKKMQKQAASGAASGSATSFSASEKPDDVYATTIAMSSCMVLAFPFDLPSYIPALLAALVRHVSNPHLKDLITKTVQDFKSTHQDRWDEFKLHFSREQLEDIQGAGAAHYFS